MNIKNLIQTTIKEVLNKSKVLLYDDILKYQSQFNPYSDILFSNPTSKFTEETINIGVLRDLNGFNDSDGTVEQTVSYFNDVGMDEDYVVSKKLMNKIISGIELNPIVVDENYKILDGSHRLAAYSELYYFYNYEFPFNGDLKIFKRISN